MPQKSQHVTGALFDVKPAPGTGGFSRAQAPLPVEVNLRTQPRETRVAVATTAALESEPVIRATSRLVSDAEARAELSRMLEESVAKEVAFSPTLASSEPIATPKPARARGSLQKPSPAIEERWHQDIATELRRSRPVSEYGAMANLNPEESSVRFASAMRSEEVGEWWSGASTPLPADPTRVIHMPPIRAEAPRRSIRWGALFGFVLVAGLVTAGMVGLSRYGSELKSRVMRDSTIAIDNLSQAKEHIAELRFHDASANFLSAFEQFSKLQKDVDVFGDGLGALIAKLPGTDAYRTGRNLVRAGTLIADAGHALTDAVDKLSSTGAVLQQDANTRTLVTEKIRPLAAALALADANMERAAELVADIDPNVLPEDKRAALAAFSEQLPALHTVVRDGVKYIDLLQYMIGIGDDRRFLVLFLNDSEVRPMGGFPGSYGILEFSGGRMSSFKADDIYNPDGQLKEKIVPPTALQHITPHWAMRDAGWFIDGPTSAETTLSFFKKETGLDADGVIALNTKVLGEVLDVVGEIKVPAYNITLKSDSFLEELQREVEYGENRKQNKPKQVIVDAAPLVVDRIATGGREQWLSLLRIFVGALERKDMLMYFRNEDVQAFAREKGFDGHIRSDGGDFLMTVFSNVKGAKTDALTDTKASLKTTVYNAASEHTLSLTRTHKGGDHELPIYNTENPSYVRVVVPRGAQLGAISGNDAPGYTALTKYTDATVDATLRGIEEGTELANGVRVTTEGDRTVFGFWMITKPGSEKTVTLSYSVPRTNAGAYELTVQKQPGMILKPFDMALSFPDAPKVQTESSLTKGAAAWSWSGALERDLVIRFTTQ
ncbi:MAG: DUF4012 domain-containing protein [Patescibacteria group bacterium]